MSYNLDDVNIGGQLKVGTGIVPAVKEGDERINGSMYAEGPVVLGGPTEFPNNKATLMVGRTKNNDKDCEPADRSLHVRGNSYLEGDDGTRDALFVTQGSTQHGVHVVGGGIGKGVDGSCVLDYASNVEKRLVRQACVPVTCE